jgi:hypothetical protein
VTIIDRTMGAELLFATGQTPESTRAAVRAIVRQYRLHPDIAEAVDVMAQEFGDHPAEAAARMARCRALTPGRIELPDNISPAEAALIGCETDTCTSPGPYTPVGRRLHCLPCAAQKLREALLGESAGPDTDQEGEDRG